MRAGLGRAVITPPLPVALAGFSDRTGPATEVHDDLEVQVLLLGDGRPEATVCLLVLDLLGMSAAFADPVRDAVAAELGLPRPAVLTSCVHTHAGPNCITGGEALGWPTPERYLDLLVERCVAAAREAKHAFEPARLAHGSAPLPADVSVNRRGNPYDPRFSVVDLTSERGDRLGTLANVAIHPVALGRDTVAVSSDWVGAFRDAAEAALGGRAVVLAGALGDVNPRPHEHGDTDGSFEHAETVGRDVAAAVTDATAQLRPIDGDVTVVSFRQIDVPAEGLLAALAGSGERMGVELVEWRIGPLTLVSVPGEAFHAMGRAIEAARRDGPVLIAGLSPVWQGYLPDPYGDGYEESVSFGPKAVAGIRQALVHP